MSAIPVGSGRLGTCQAFATSATSAATPNGFGAQTYAVLIAATVACNIVVANAPVATTTSQLLPANTTLVLTVNPGQKRAAVSATAGEIFVSELE
jgi:hypothetical protein